MELCIINRYELYLTKLLQPNWSNIEMTYPTCICFRFFLIYYLVLAGMSWAWTPRNHYHWCYHPHQNPLIAQAYQEWLDQLRFLLVIPRNFPAKQHLEGIGICMSSKEIEQKGTNECYRDWLAWGATTLYMWWKTLSKRVLFQKV